MPSLFYKYLFPIKERTGDRPDALRTERSRICLKHRGLPAHGLDETAVLIDGAEAFHIQLQKPLRRPRRHYEHGLGAAPRRSFGLRAGFLPLAAS